MINVKAIFDSAYTAFQEAHATVRVNMDSPEVRVLLPRLDRARKNSEMGAAISQPIRITMIQSEEQPAGGFGVGVQILFKRIVDSDYRRARVEIRSETAGVLTLTLGGVNE